MKLQLVKESCNMVKDHRLLKQWAILTISEFSAKVPNSSSGMRNLTKGSAARTSGMPAKQRRYSSSCLAWAFTLPFFSGLSGREVAEGDKDRHDECKGEGGQRGGG